MAPDMPQPRRLPDFYIGMSPTGELAALNTDAEAISWLQARADTDCILWLITPDKPPVQMHLIVTRPRLVPKDWPQP